MQNRRAGSVETRGSAYYSSTNGKLNLKSVHVDASNLKHVLAFRRIITKGRVYKSSDKQSRLSFDAHKPLAHWQYGHFNLKVNVVDNIIL